MATVHQFIAKDKVYSSMYSIKDTPLGKKLFKALAIAKQLGIPTYFITLSYADL